MAMSSGRARRGRPVVLPLAAGALRRWRSIGWALSTTTMSHAIATMKPSSFATEMTALKDKILGTYVRMDVGIAGLGLR